MADPGMERVGGGRRALAPLPEDFRVCPHVRKTSSSRSDLGRYVECRDCGAVTWAENGLAPPETCDYCDEPGHEHGCDYCDG